MVTRISPKIIRNNAQHDNLGPRERPRGSKVLHLARNTVALFLLAISIVAVAPTIAAQTGADTSSISAIQSALRAGDNEQALTLVHSQLQNFPKDVRLWALERPPSRPA